ncbi:uncharacterized protein CLBA1 [Orycteropus afer afer]|uniref:Uncharacterized protein CLBA1 n=1 Tax=Orycteropus afer afer TaxID=1230840 RepID=A0A8B7A9R9_ORYAF|nr:uncharacterized protein CLBA1 [Orycteropus afer afer]
MWGAHVQVSFRTLGGGGWQKAEAPSSRPSSPACRQEAGGSSCPCPDPGQHGSAWGDFEGFRESSARSEPFSQCLGRLAGPAALCHPEERGSLQPHEGGRGGTHAALVTPSEVIAKSLAPPEREALVRVPLAGASFLGTALRTPLAASGLGPPICPHRSAPVLSYEDIFKAAFPEVPVQAAAPDVPVLACFLEVPSEETTGLASGPEPFCLESGRLWRSLQDTREAQAWQGFWLESGCRESFLLVLGIDAAQQSLTGGSGPGLEGPPLMEQEEPVDGSSPPWDSRSGLIQTQFSGSPGCRQGALITYGLFLKKMPFPGHMQHLPVPRKQPLFTWRSLAMALLRRDVC